jgi:predicted amidohydrolase
MKVRVCQTAPALYDVGANLEVCMEKVERSAEEGVDLVVFPELTLTGYFVGEMYHEVALKMDSPEIQKLLASSKGTAAVVGFIEESPHMNFYNSALVMRDGEMVQCYRKLNLPNYGSFEERKYFSPGRGVPIFRFMGFNVATFICNDMWHPSLPYLAVSQGADIFITIINSSQGSMGDEFSNIETWQIINSFYARVFGIYNICANRVGEESNGKTYKFWGGSEIIDPFGHQIMKAPLYEEFELDSALSRELLRKKRILLPYLRGDDPQFTYRELGKILNLL